MQFGNTALHESALNGYHNIVSLLIANKATVNLQNTVRDEWVVAVRLCGHNLGITVIRGGDCIFFALTVIFNIVH